MKTLGLIAGILSLLGMMLAFLPFLGWLNWFNIFFAMAGLVINGIARYTTGLLLCAFAIFFGFIRLILGGGVL